MCFRNVGGSPTSFGKKIFVEDGYYSENSSVSDFDKIIYAGSLIKFFRKNK